jgi:hypothetical protein
MEAERGAELEEVGRGLRGYSRMIDGAREGEKENMGSGVLRSWEGKRGIPVET